MQMFWQVRAHPAHAHAQRDICITQDSNDLIRDAVNEIHSFVILAR